MRATFQEIGASEAVSCTNHFPGAFSLGDWPVRFAGIGISVISVTAHQHSGVNKGMYEPTLKSGHIPVLIATRPFRGPTILHSESPHVKLST